MLHNDSLDKIITRYFATVTREPFSYNDKLYTPRPLKISPLLLRDYTCPPGCGGCCFKFTLDYLPTEGRPTGAKQRWVEFSGRSVEIWSDAQAANETNRCRHLEPGTGRCGIYAIRPFSCDFELIRTLQPVEIGSDEYRPNILTQKLFGRGWSYPRVDGGKGALCEMLPASEHSIKEVLRKLGRLQQWANHFKLSTWVPNIVKLVKTGALQRSGHHIVLSNTMPEIGFGL